MALLLFLAALPFGIKAVTMASGATGYVLLSGYKIAQVLSPVAWRIAKGERGPEALWPAQRRPSGFLLALGAATGVAFGLGAIAAASVLVPASGMQPSDVRDGFDRAFEVDGYGALAVAAFLAFANSAIEEAHFRLWLDRELSERLGDAAGIALSALAFGAMHGFIFLGMPAMPLPLAAVAVAALVLAGTCWSALARRPGGFYAAWLSHGLCDALLLTWGLFWLGYL